MERKIRILVISLQAWRNDNATGNSYTNIFSDMDEMELFHLYCQGQKPNVQVAKRFYQISDKDIIHSCLDRSIEAGNELESDCYGEDKIELSKSMDFFKALQWTPIYWCRDIVWSIGNWKNKKLNAFLDNIQPDILFVNLADYSHVNKIACYVQEYTGAIMVPYVWDDIYTLKQFSLSPLYWINRLYNRKYIKRVVDHSNYMFTITEEQRREYSKIFHIDCGILFKGHSFLDEKKDSSEYNPPFRIVYMGQLGQGRWRTVEKIGKAIDIFNKRHGAILFQLRVYTITSLTASVKKRLTISDSCMLMDYVEQKKVDAVLQSASILLHVEPTDIKGRMYYRLSFSTKIVDYFKQHKCILAIGSDTATMNYLRKNDAAIIANKTVDIQHILERVYMNPSIVNEYADKAYCCGKEKHDISTIRNNVIQVFRNIIGEKRCDR